MGSEETPEELQAIAGNSALTAHAWLIWLLAAATFTILSRNPLYTTLILLVVAVVYHRVRPRGAVFPFSWLRLGGFMLLIPALFYALSLSSGNTILARLPAQWPLIGGPITLEAMVLGASNGLLLFTLLLLFATFNRALPASELIRLTPRALHHLGIVVLIALTYIPETLAQGQRIREAQAIRGYELKGWRGWRPLLLPLLISGLERAMEVAEAMVARGYGSTGEQPHSTRRQMGMLVGLAAAFLGWLLILVGIVWGWGALVGGILWLLWLVWRAGRQVTFSRYQQQTWQPWDGVVIIASLVPLPLLLWLTPATLLYIPFPRLTLPPFEPLWGAALLALLTPGLRTEE
ncbi:MAG: energy-coupling factor transporter transmembrane protein EcfT [Anaerolineae bacterium]|nr:energy-coupling factor transporter transmembrane protein EcfT [Anaerolineae bacterium]